jgi:hypothetical protein
MKNCKYSRNVELILMAANMPELARAINNYRRQASSVFRQGAAHEQTRN